MMSNIVKQFAGDRKLRPQEPNMMPPPPPRARPDEHTAQALVFVTRLNEEVELLREDNARLRADLNIERMRNRDLERKLDALESTTEAYRRYSVEVKTHLQHISDAAMRANEAALDAGEQHMTADRVAARVLEETERGVRELSASEIAAKYAAPKEPATIDQEPH